MNSLSTSQKSFHKSIGVTLATTCLLGLSPFISAQEAAPANQLAKPANQNSEIPEIPEQGQTRVQIAILLDTSSSMNGLIDQAKSQLWKVVNSFNEAEKNGKIPFVEVALYEYGNSGLNMQKHYIRQLQPLTRDLDEVSKELFNLKTNGGEEYCGAVIKQAITELKWDKNPKTYKAIFIAGNEPFTQGPVNAVTSCKEALQHNVIVNTIHCGDEATGINGGWKIGALAAGGNFAIINQDKAVAHIPSPQDQLILKLNQELNTTYIPYGAQGNIKLENQVEQDNNAGQKAKQGAAVQRAQWKSSHNYWNGNWDLCDASKAKGFDWTKLDKKTLPKKLQTKTAEELKAYVADNQKKRREIQEKMKLANKERALYVAKVRAEKKGYDKANTLDEAIQNAVKTQAKKRGYIFK